MNANFLPGPLPPPRGDVIIPVSAFIPAGVTFIAAFLAFAVLFSLESALARRTLKPMTYQSYRRTRTIHAVTWTLAFIVITVPVLVYILICATYSA